MGFGGTSALGGGGGGGFWKGLGNFLQGASAGYADPTLAYKRKMRLDEMLAEQEFLAGQNDLNRQESQLDRAARQAINEVNNRAAAERQAASDSAAMGREVTGNTAAAERQKADIKAAEERAQQGSALRIKEDEAAVNRTRLNTIKDVAAAFPKRLAVNPAGGYPTTIPIADPGIVGRALLGEKATSAIEAPRRADQFHRLTEAEIADRLSRTKEREATTGRLDAPLDTAKLQALAESGAINIKPDALKKLEGMTLRELLEMSEAINSLQNRSSSGIALPSGVFGAEPGSGAAAFGAW